MSDLQTEIVIGFFEKALDSANDPADVVRQVSCTPTLLIWLAGNTMDDADIALIKSRASNSRTWLPRFA